MDISSYVLLSHEQALRRRMAQDGVGSAQFRDELRNQRGSVGQPRGPEATRQRFRDVPRPEVHPEVTAENREIGEILTISPRTVNKHLEQIFVKLGVENRASAAAP